MAHRTIRSWKMHSVTPRPLRARSCKGPQGHAADPFVVSCFIAFCFLTGVIDNKLAPGPLGRRLSSDLAFLRSGMTVLWKPFGRGWYVEQHTNPQSACTFFLQLVERKLGAGCLRTLGRPWGNMPCPTSPSRPRAHWATVPEAP